MKKGYWTILYWSSKGFCEKEGAIRPTFPSTQSFEDVKVMDLGYESDYKFLDNPPVVI